MLHRVGGVPLDFAALRSQLDVPGDFSAAVNVEAEAVAARRRTPVSSDDPASAGAATIDGYLDARHLELVTIDPAGSRDLDQAVNVVAAAGGFRVSYAIADVARFVDAGSAIDVEARRRGETLYFPDRRVPLHPPQLSEGVASLLPGQDTPAVLWQIDLADDGAPTRVSVHRALVRSRAQLTYDQVQSCLGSDELPPPIAALAQVGERRAELARSRHSIDLGLPEQLVVAVGNSWTLQLRRALPAELHNAQISLLTGMCAATIMLEGGVGILRTLPPPPEDAVAALRRAARALGIDWRDGTPAGDVLASLDPQQPRHAALIGHATSLLRGAAYTAFDGAAPQQPMHSGIAAPYAHVTAPLRRLVDRFGSEICLALQAGREPPNWVREALPLLPEQMRAADRLAHTVDRAVVDMTEAWVLRDRVGAEFDAVVIDADAKAATIVIAEPAIRARCAGPTLPVGQQVRVRLVSADVSAREVRFEAVDPTVAPGAGRPNQV